MDPSTKIIVKEKTQRLIILYYFIYIMNQVKVIYVLAVSMVGTLGERGGIS